MLSAAEIAYRQADITCCMLRGVHVSLAMSAGNIQHIMRLAEARKSAAQRGDQRLAFLHRQPEMRCPRRKVGWCR